MLIYSDHALICVVCRKMDNEQPKIKSRAMSWSAYYTIEEIYAWFDELAVTYSDRITVVEGGSSYEGRKIKGAILATNPVSST